MTSTITNTKEEENKKLKEEAEKHKKVVDEIKEGNQKLKSEIQNALEKKWFYGGALEPDSSLYYYYMTIMLYRLDGMKVEMWDVLIK